MELVPTLGSLEESASFQTVKKLKCARPKSSRSETAVPENKWRRMKNKKSAIGNDLQTKNRTFVRANAAWDRGDLHQAFALFMQAAKEGDASSQLNLGYFFDQGLSVEQDKKKALEWYRRAYKQGDAGAANNIATVT